MTIYMEEPGSAKSMLFNKSPDRPRHTQRHSPVETRELEHVTELKDLSPYEFVSRLMATLPVADLRDAEQAKPKRHAGQRR